jgi:hypothetical protein
MAALPQLTRDKLALFLKTPELIRAYEALQQGLQFAPDDIAAAQAAAAAAQTTATAAGAAAAAAQGTANAAQADASALKLPQYLTLALSGTLTNERSLAIDPLSLKSVDAGAGAAFTLSTADLTSILGADVADSTAAFVDATGLLLALLANATYLIDGLITFQSAAVTTGIALGFTLPAGATISGAYKHNTTATAIEGSYNIASGAVKGNTSGVLTAADNVPITGRWVIKTAAAAGNAQMQFRSEVAASAVTLKAGLSVLVAKRVA